MLLVIVNDLYVGRPECSFDPFKTDPPLIVNADALLALAISDQRFEAVAWQCGEIAQRCDRLHSIELETRRPFKARKRLYVFSGSEVSGPVVPIADYQSTP